MCMGSLHALLGVWRRNAEVPGERGLELICSVVGEAGWKLQLSMWEHAGGEESLKGKGKPGFKERCLKMTQRLYMMPLRYTNMHLHWSRNFKEGVHYHNLDH